MRILLIEDDSPTVRIIELILKTEGFICDTVGFGEDGIETAKFYDYDAVILDLVLPDMEGLKVLQEIRAAGVDTPVLILSGLKEVSNKVKGLGYGADDYLTKPFNKSELIARLQAVIRRSKGHSDSVVYVGDRLSINLQARIAEVDGEPLLLTSKEYATLEFLVLSKGRILSKEMFLSHLYGGMDEPELKIIDVFICKLRKKLAEVMGSAGADLIETVWGRGYLMRNSKPKKLSSDKKIGGHRNSNEDIINSINDREAMSI